MVVLESLAAIVANLEKELACFRTHVPLFSELLIEISRDVNVDLNVVSEVLLGMLDHMQKHLTCCWKLLQDFYKKVACSTLPGPFFRDSEVGQMPEELVEMLGSMTEHMVRFRRVCESRLKGQHYRGHCNSGYSRSLHLALTCCVTTTEQAKKLVRPVSVRVLRLTAQDLDDKFGLRCRLSSNSVNELREKLKLGEMKALHQQLRSAALLWNKRRKAQLRCQRKLRLQKLRNKVDSRQKQAIAKIKLSTSLLPKQTLQLRPHRVTRRSVVLAAKLEPLNDVTRDEPSQQPRADGGTSKANKNTSDNARRSGIRRLTESCSDDSHSFRCHRESKKRAYSPSGHRKVSTTPRFVASVYDKGRSSGPSLAGVTSRAPEAACSAQLRRLYATRSSTERSGRPPLSVDRNGSPPLSSVGKSSGQLGTSTSNSLISNIRRKSDLKRKPLRAILPGTSFDGDNNSSSRRSLRQESPCHSYNDRKVLTLERRFPRSQDMNGNTSSSSSLLKPSVTVKSGPVRTSATINVILPSSQKRRSMRTRSPKIPSLKLETSS